MYTVLDSCIHQHLTVYGKVAVLNSLYYSRIYYHLMVNCNPNLAFYQEIKHKVLKCLWDNKHAKIAYDLLIGDKNIGGIKLVKLAKKNTSLKITWSIEFFIP